MHGNRLDDMIMSIKTTSLYSCAEPMSCERDTILSTIRFSGKKLIQFVNHTMYDVCYSL